MSPQHFHISGGGVPPPIVDESWSNRTLARATARDTQWADVDPGGLITHSWYAAGVKAVSIRDVAAAKDRVLVTSRGRVAVFDDDGDPGDPLENKTTGSWPQLMDPGARHQHLINDPDDNRQAICFQYFLSSGPYPAAGVYTVAYKLRVIDGDVGIVASQIMAEQVLPQPPTGWTGIRVPSFGVLAHKQHFGVINNGGNDLTILQANDAGAPSSSGDPHANVAFKIFVSDEAGDPENLGGGGGGVGPSQLFNGPTPRYIQAIEFDPFHNGGHVVIGTHINFVEGDNSSNFYDQSSFNEILDNLLTPSLAGFTRKACHIVPLPDASGRLVLNYAGYIGLLDFSLGLGYTTLDETFGTIENDSAYEMGLFRACTGSPSDTRHSNQGGMHKQPMMYMGEVNDTQELLTIGAFGQGVSTRSLAIPDSTDTIGNGPSIVEPLGTLPFANSDTCAPYSNCSARKDDDTVYVFHNGWDNGLNRMQTYGAIIRK